MRDCNAGCDSRCLVQVRDALASKVSRERVGTELEGMLKGTPPTSWTASTFGAVPCTSIQAGVRSAGRQRSWVS